MKKRIPTVNFYKDKKGDWRWSLTAPNGRVIADCGQGYSSKAMAKKGFTAVQDTASLAVECE